MEQFLSELYVTRKVFVSEIDHFHLKYFVKFALNKIVEMLRGFFRIRFELS